MTDLVLRNVLRNPNALQTQIVGASSTGVIEIVLVFESESVPSETVVVRVLATVLFVAVVYLILPAVLK